MPRDHRLYLDDIIGLRNILVHRYFGVNAAIVWEVARDKVPSLEETCTRLLKE